MEITREYLNQPTTKAIFKALADTEARQQVVDAGHSVEELKLIQDEE